jgi:hypothetical protein
MQKLHLLAFVVLISVSALACSSTSNPGNETGGSGGSNSGGSAGTGGSTGGSRGGSGGNSGGTSDSGSCPKFDYTNYNPTMSPTLKNDIQQIFANSCALASSCHQIGGSHHPFLGLSLFQLDGGKLTDPMLQTVISEISNKPSTEVAVRNLAVPGKPEDSYLMNKIEGTNDCSGFACMGPDKCGIQMPDPQTPLEKNQMDLIRAWIKKGMTM